MNCLQEENAFASGSKPRPKSKVVGARAPRVRQEIQMTASGAFGQGPRVSGSSSYSLPPPSCL